MTLYKKIRYIKKRYESFKVNPLTQRNAFLALSKYLYSNTLLYVFNREFEFTFLNDIKVRATKGDGIMGNYHSVLQEPVDSVFLLHFLRDEDTFVDIGANVGHYSLLAGVKTNAKIISIEPIPKTFRRFYQNLEINQLTEKVKSLNIGLSDKKGELHFSNEAFTTNKVVKDGNGIKVPVDTLDAVCEKEQVNLMKIDVEGFEWFVLQGAASVLNSESLKVIIIELNGAGKNFGIEDDQIVAFLNALGYQQFEYNIFSRELTPILSKNNKQFNTLFIKDLNFVKNRLVSAKEVNVKEFVL